MAANKSAMVIEDEDHISYLVNFLLQKEGFSVSLARDGEKAKSMIDIITPPRLVILDIKLPFYDGYELLKHIRSKPDWKDVPVLMLTAKAQKTDIIRAMDIGANDYLVKPFQPLELLARINKMVTNHT